MVYSTLDRKKDTNIDIVLLLYWIALVFWQNINPGATGSSADTLLKTVLILVLFVYYISHAGKFSAFSVGCVFFLAANAALSFFLESFFSLRSMLTYFFPVSFAFLSCCVGGKFEITRLKLLRFMRVIIVVVLYMAIYAVLTTPEKFFNALSTQNAYGNELHSFLYSSHEYGMYLMAGIVSCILCYDLDVHRTKKKNVFLLICAAFFLINLILTYSRTSMLATALIIFSYMFLNRKRRVAKLFLSVAVVGLLSIMVFPVFRNYFFEIMLKGNNDAGRGNLAILAVDTFKEGYWYEKLWGQGAMTMRDFFQEETTHASVHNAYLQVLLHFGIIPLCIMISFIVAQLVASIKLTKRNRVFGVLWLGLTLACCSTMLTNTTVLFSSPIDSYFLTIFTVTIPRYVKNAIYNNNF